MADERPQTEAQRDDTGAMTQAVRSGGVVLVLLMRVRQRLGGHGKRRGVQRDPRPKTTIPSQRQFQAHRPTCPIAAKSEALVKVH